MSKPEGISAEDWKAFCNSRPTILRDTRPAEVTLIDYPRRISPELIAMMRNFVDAIENNSDPTIPLDLLRHSIEIAYDRLR